VDQVTITRMVFPAKKRVKKAQIGMIVLDAANFIAHPAAFNERDGDEVGPARRYYLVRFPSSDGSVLRRAPSFSQYCTKCNSAT